MPYDFYSLVSFRIYLDSVREQLPLLDKASKPPRYIVMTPSLYSAWYEWYEKLPDKAYGKKQMATMNKLGEKKAPDWVIYSFNGLEDFYKHYKWITTEVE